MYAQAHKMICPPNAQTGNNRGLAWTAKNVMPRGVPQLLEDGGQVAEDDGADMDLDAEGADGGRDALRTAKGKSCSRCSQKGHAAAECVTEVYCDICDGHEHMNHRCPILKQERPVAHAVGYSVVGLGFYHIQHPPLSRKKDSKTARIDIIGGELTLEQVEAQLRRLVPGKWKWEPTQNDDGSFVVTFPSKGELQRSMAYGGTDVRENGVPTGVRMEFKEWHDKEEGFLLPKVWVRVRGLRKKLREFLNLWAVGSILGSTQTVDMKMTRKNDFGRVMVAVLDPKLIPQKLDVVIGDHYFELQFEVERVGFDENGDEVVFDFMDSEDDGNSGQREEDLNDSNSKHREPKRSRNEDTNMDFTTHNNDGGSKQTGLGGHEDLEAKLRNMADQIIFSCADRIIDELAEKVANEPEDGLVEDVLSDDDLLSSEDEVGGELLPAVAAVVVANGGRVTTDVHGPVAVHASALESPTEAARSVQLGQGRGRSRAATSRAGDRRRFAGSAPPMLGRSQGKREPCLLSTEPVLQVQETATGQHVLAHIAETVGRQDRQEDSNALGLGAVLAQPFEPAAQLGALHATGSSDANKIGNAGGGLADTAGQSPMRKLAPFAAAAAIKEAVGVSPRSSPRLAATADLHAMEKAQKRAAWKNLEHEGNHLSFLGFSDSVISSKFNAIGVALGKHEKQITASISTLKSTEQNRLDLLTPNLEQGGLDYDSDFLANTEEDYDWENPMLSHLCGDLMEETFDKDSHHLSCEFDTVFKKNKSRSSTRNKKSAKIKVLKKHKKSVR